MRDVCSYPIVKSRLHSRPSLKANDRSWRSRQIERRHLRQVQCGVPCCKPLVERKIQYVEPCALARQQAASTAFNSPLLAAIRSDENRLRALSNCTARKRGARKRKPLKSKLKSNEGSTVAHPNREQGTLNARMQLRVHML